MHKRIVNFRGFLISGLILIVNILLCYHIFEAMANHRENAFTYIEVAFVGIIFLCLIFLIVFLWIKNGYGDKVLAFIFTFICCIISSVLVLYSVAFWPDSEYITDSFLGRVANSTYKSEYNSFVVTLDEVSTKEQRLSHKVILYVESSEEEPLASYADKFETGKIIRFSTTLTKNDLNGYSYNSDIAYSAFIENDKVELVGTGETTFMEKLRNKLHKTLVDNLGYEMGELSYSMITGDKNNLAYEIKDAFSISGLGHILAVSGLHIGFITSALAWILKKCKANKYVNLAITALSVLFYCSLADFSGSVLRASIMTMILLIAMVTGNRNDTLNSLFFAVSIILTFRPLIILYVGFLMSIASVFGIIIFSPKISKLLRKIKFPKFLSNAIAVTSSATISIMPITICFFKFISPYSLITNLIALPFMGICFVAILITSFLTIVMPFMAIFLKIVSLGLALINELTNLVSKLPGASLTLYGGMLLMSIYLFYFAGSRFVMKDKTKYPIIIVCILLSVTLIVKPNIYEKKSNEIIFFQNGNNVQSIILDENKNAFFVGDFGGYNKLNEVMKISKIKKLESIYLTSISSESAYNLKRYFSSYPVVPVYIPIDNDVEGLKVLLKESIKFNTFENECSFDNGLTAHYNDEGFECYIYNSGYGKSAFFPKYTYEFSPQVLNEVQIIRTYSSPEKVVGRFNDIIFLVNADSEADLPFSYVTNRKIYSVNLPYKTVTEIKESIW